MSAARLALLVAEDGALGDRNELLQESSNESADDRDDEDEDELWEDAEDEDDDESEADIGVAVCKCLEASDGESRCLEANVGVWGRRSDSPSWSSSSSSFKSSWSFL